MMVMGREMITVFLFSLFISFSLLILLFLLSLLCDKTAIKKAFLLLFTLTNFYKTNSSYSSFI